MLSFFADLKPCGLLLYDRQQQRFHLPAHIPFDLFPVNGTVNIQDQGLMGFQHIQQIQESLLPVIMGTIVGNGGMKRFLQCPICQIIDILEMIVESHSADPAGFRYIIDGDFRDLLFLQKLLEGVCEGLLCCIVFHDPFPPSKRVG